ncbi:porin [Paraburkholderia caribensis]|uniref:porin n=1 Tax=Paraburkholderia caribensis TaxID=75105 RepID=UPI00078E0D1D|nr:porin [Paraburkholderia caribensis]AMV48295.1 hypothetical protein ATN79_47390 [Paraburkholderia caribensis]
MKQKAIGFFIATSTALSAVPALAQNSINLYGFIDSGLSYQNSETRLGSTSGGSSSIKATSGSWFGSRIGIKGNDVLDGKNQVIYLLENGFSSDNGAEVFGSLFGRQAYVGLANDQLGSFTVGRQYPSYYLLLVPYSPTTWLTGSVGAHPGDIDGLDFTYRINNALQYTSPNMHGFPRRHTSCRL